MFCRGRPMCRPGHGSSREASAGGHIGPPLRDMGWCSGTNGNWRRTGPPPPGRDGARPLRGTGGVRGGVRLGCGFRQPNFGTKFGASVIGIGPYEFTIGKGHQPNQAGRGGARPLQGRRRQCAASGPWGRRPLRVVAGSFCDCRGNRRVAERLRRGEGKKHPPRIAPYKTGFTF